MVLARDMLTDQGAVLLTKDNVLTDDVIERIRIVEKTWGEQLTIFVWKGRRVTDTASPPAEVRRAG